MEKNVGGTDRKLRVGTTILVAVAMDVRLLGSRRGISIRSGVMSVLLVLGAVLLATAGTEKCVLNSALGRNTYGVEEGKQ